jgi:hypothetical protein
MILPSIRDKRFITIRRGGVLKYDDHRLLALWAADCAEHVLPIFQTVFPDDLLLPRINTLNAVTHAMNRWPR